MSNSDPHLQLIALAEAWPFRAPVGFEHSLTRLVHAERNKRGTSTGELASEFERTARTLAHGQSLATLEALRDRQWFEDGSEQLELTPALLRLARRHLRWDGDVIRLAAGQPDSRHAQTMRWRWLSLNLPQDLLIAALAVSHGVSPCADRVKLVGRGLERILAEPVAETHLHVGAALDFGELWIALLDGATGPNFGARIKQVPAPFANREAYLRTLVSAALVRQLLAAFLWQVERLPPHEAPSFARFVRERVPVIAARTGNRARADRVEGAFHCALATLRTGLGMSTDSSLPSLLRAHHLLWGPRARTPTLDALLRADPLHAWLQPGPGDARPETTFISRALRHGAGQDPHFQRSTWQYLRVRNLVFAHLVEAPGTAGLGWFTRHFDRLRGHRHALGERVAESALRLESSGLNLRSLELRTSPDARWFEVRKQLHCFVDQAKAFEPALGDERPELAVVFHWIKQRERPGRYVLRCRHGRWFHDASQRANAIARMLRLDPKLLLVLRGLDVAADELAVPNWVLRPLFVRAREASRVAAARLAAERPSWKVPSLQATLHAGEEFYRLSGGLRRIHEAIEFGLLGEGDRIGHGLALGWPVELWCARHRHSVQPREERLWDLLWELERYRAGDLTSDASRLAFVTGQLDTLSRELFGELVAASELIDLRRRLFDSTALTRKYNYPFGPRTPPADDLARYLVDPHLRRRAKAPIEVPGVPSEHHFLVQAQNWLCNQLSKLTITIEANPSSNLIIGDFGDFSAHPTFALSAPHSPGSIRTNQLPVSINTDDPLTFASCLADEYAYVEAALVGRETSANEALRWLDEARKAGWRSRFSLPASAQKSALEALQERRQRSHRRRSSSGPGD